MPTAYDLQREENMRRNRELLAACGIDKPLIEPKFLKPQRAKPTKHATSKKRKASPTDENENEMPAKALRNADDAESAGPRRSARNSGKPVVDYRGEQDRSLPESFHAKKLREADPELGPVGREDGRRVHDPKTFGSIPGIEVGTWWEGRKGCSVDAIHAPLVAGISGGPKGAYSVALSGGYEDDVDEGYAFTYTGSGGRDLKGTKAKPKNLRTAPQSSDQSFENAFNAALQKSTQTKKPVRVIRGFKSKSRYAPLEGYRYDGLYTVEKAWMEAGLNEKGFLVCKFLFKRLSGQPPVPVRWAEGEGPTPDTGVEGSAEVQGEDDGEATDGAVGEEDVAEEES